MSIGRRMLTIVAVLALAVLGRLDAQAPADTTRPDTVATDSLAGAPVLLGEDTLFMLYSRLGPFSPAQRAAAVSQRIAQKRRTIASGLDSLAVLEVEGRSEIQAGEDVLMTVLDGDAAPSGRPRADLAVEYAETIRQAALTSARQTSLRALALGALYAVAATAVLVLLLKLLRIIFHRLYHMLAAGRVPALKIQKLELLSAQRLGESLTFVARVLRVILTLILLYIYVPLVLSFFPWTAPYSRRIVGYVVNPLESVWAGFIAYLPKIFFIVVIFLVTRYILKLILLIFRAIESGTLTFAGFHRDWALPTYNIVRFLVIAFALVVMFPYLPGAGSDAFKGVSLFIGVLFSLGSSGAVGNIVAGVVLTYTRAFQLGDRVKIGDTTGDVIERTLLVTRLRTIKNVDVTIPNGSVLSNQVINYTTQAHLEGVVLHTTVTIGYDVPWQQVHDLLIAAARGAPEVLDDPAPFVLQTSLDDFYVSYELNAFTRNPRVMARTYSAIHQNIQDRFNEAGVEIMSPHYRAMRDGNQVTIPSSYLAADYEAPPFRIRSLGGEK